MRQKLALLILASSLVAAFGCNSSPYPQNDDVISSEPVHGKAGIHNLTVEVEPVTDIAEGQVSTLSLVPHVSSGKPLLTFDHLPTWAIYDPAHQEINCNPPVGASADPLIPGQKFAEYRVNANLSSNTSPGDSSQQQFVIVVHPQMDSLQVIVNNPYPTIYEGDNYSDVITLRSKAYPQGPFAVSAVGLPSGAAVTPGPQPDQVTLSYSPNPFAVQTSSAYACWDPRTNNNGWCQYVYWQIKVTDPAGVSMTSPLYWVLTDKRQLPLVIAPATVAADDAQNVDFYIQVEDPNGEVIPQVSLSAPPPSGAIILTVAAQQGWTSVSNPYVLTHFRWINNPATMKGSVQTLNVQACVNGNDTSTQSCSNVPIAVSF